MFQIICNKKKKKKKTCIALTLSTQTDGSHVYQNRYMLNLSLIQYFKNVNPFLL